MFHTCCLTLRIDRDVRVSSLPKVLRALSAAFAIRELSHVVGARTDLVDMVRVRRKQSPTLDHPELWLGEMAEPDARLTRYQPSDEKVTNPRNR